MTYKNIYKDWLEKADKETKMELEEIKNNPKEMEDRFYKLLDFGTAGLRGIMGAGTNRMNKYVIGQATQAFANIIIEEKRQKDGVAIAFDCRINSKEYSKYVASVFAANNIKVYLFDNLRPTPELSYAIRYLKTAAGVNVTASHNPKEYNGYKVYWDEGAQILTEYATRIQNEIKKIDVFSGVKVMDYEEAIKNKQIEIIGEEIDIKFKEEVLKLALNDDIDRDINIVYSPFNGAGYKLIPEVIKARGFNNLTMVKEQAQPDGTFPTLPYPNPELSDNFEIAIKYAKKTNADIVLASDPDADRIAIAVKDNDNNYIPFNGNQTGILLINYILSNRKTRKANDAIVKTIVTGDMGEKICKKYDIKMIETLTGFKYICGLANEYEKTKEYNYLFGYEESIGYNPGTFVRDKDAVTTAMLLVEMCAYYKKSGKSLYDVMYELYNEFGFYKETQFSTQYKGIEGAKIKEGVMKAYRENYLKKIYGLDLVEKIDFLYDDTKLDKTDALKYRFSDGSWYAIRPSGTEPKLKTYIYVVDENEATSDEKLKVFEDTIKKTLDEVERMVKA